MNRLCPDCGAALPRGVRAEFCPVCVLREAREPGGEVLGDYELLEEIGRGGMGVVWRARQRGLARIVAVKVVLGGEFASTDARERFRAEAHAAARLQHPHIVAIHEIGEADGLPFFSMDFIEGSTLDDLVRAEPLTARRAAELVQTIAGAVQHAHTHGVLHRDLKPSNILVDAGGAPRITDFGLAKLADAGGPLTLTAQAIGSPAYMPPEQARGGSASPASDVYALGAILYHLLAGRPPFQGETVATILAQVENAEPLPPRRLSPSIPADLQNICLKCLEKNPARRYTTAQALAEDLGRFLDGAPVIARPVGAAGAAWRWSRRHPALAGLWLALVALAVISTIAAILIQRANVRGRASLRESLLAETHSTRLAALPGHRARTLDAAARAVALGPTAAERVRLRGEMIASLSLLDAHFEPASTLPSIPDLTRVAFDATHELCAHSTPTGPVIVQRLRDGAEVHRFECGPHRVWNIVAFSADRRFLLIRDPRNLCVFEIATGRLCLERSASLHRGVFAPDSGSIAIAQRDDDLAVFELPSGKELRRWPVRAEAIALSPDGAVLAVATVSHIELRDFHDGTLRRTLPASAAMTAPAWSADGAWLAAGAVSGEITLWDAVSGAIIRRFDGHHGAIRSLAFDPARTLLASGSEDATVRLWELTSQRPSLSVSVQSYGFHFSPDGRALGPVWAFGPTGLLALARPEGFLSLRAEPAVESRFSVTWSPDGRWLAAASAEGVRVWESSNHQLLATERFVAECVEFDPRSGALAVGTPDGVRRYALPATPAEPLRLIDHLLAGEGCPGVTFSRDGTRLAVARDARDVIDLVPSDDPTRAVTIYNGQQIWSVVFSPDARWIAGTTEFGAAQVFVWQTATSELAAKLAADGAQSTAFSPDGRWLAVFGTRPQLWATATWQPAAGLDLGLRNELAGRGAFTPDGKMIAVLLGPGIPHLLALEENRAPQLLAVLESQTAPRLRALAFSPDGQRLAGAGPLGQVEVWDLAALRSRLRERGLNW